MASFDEYMRIYNTYVLPPVHMIVVDISTYSLIMQAANYFRDVREDGEKAEDCNERLLELEQLPTQWNITQ